MLFYSAPSDYQHVLENLAMPRRFKEKRPAGKEEAATAGDNANVFFFGGFDHAGNAVAPGIDPEILREEEQNARHNNGGSAETGSRRQMNAVDVSSGMALKNDASLDDDEGGLKQQDFAALQMAVNAAKLMEEAGDVGSQRYLSSSVADAQVAAAVAKAVQKQQQKQSQYPYNTGFGGAGPQDGQDGQGGSSAHNLFGGQGSDLAGNYAHYIPKVQQQIRELRQQQQQQQHQEQHMRNALMSQQQQVGSSEGMMGTDMNAPHHSINGKRRIRLRWTEDETKMLIDGCKVHSVGNWKKILTDPRYHFNNRTAVDLKDRFRTSFPEEYSRLYPNARTHKSKRKSASMESSVLKKIDRKERRSFTREEDQRLLEGFVRHGAAWSKIQRDETLGLGDRRSTDLRDRFRNAFPERYVAAGYKGRGTPKRPLQTLPSDADQAAYIKHNMDAAAGAAAEGSGYLLDGSIYSERGQGLSGSGENARSAGVLSPSFKAATAAFANAMDADAAELADPKHQEDVMSSIRLEGLNGDDEDDEDENDDEAEGRELIRRQVELERVRLQQQQQQKAQQKGSAESAQDHQRRRSSRSTSPTLIAAAAAAAQAVAAVTNEDSKSSIGGDETEW